MTMTQTFYKAGMLDEFLSRIGRVLVVDGQEIAVFRTSDNAVFALENRNPHPKGGTIAEGIVSGHILYDPLYDWQIDLATGKVQAPDEGQVRTFPVKLEQGAVWIGL
ncbi:nitrite reductase small subunit NirD [Paenibacillus campi]|uniref:nitrite reductase small subunit NirD n=1 Tax=Paenibacillus campi TaxID=3106031 RepID=UPI002AFDFF4E|nr:MULTISPECIES: nitrite reductase small subunit NirD [unclassified Paenibacillus]